MPTTQLKPRPKILRRPRRGEFVDPTDLKDLLPVLGSFLRGKKLIKATLRSRSLLQKLRVPQPQRTIAAAQIGARSLLKTGKMKPGGAVLYGIDKTGRAVVRGFKRKGIRGAISGSAIGVRNAASSIKRSGEKLISPAVLVAKKSKRAYGLLNPDLPKRRRVSASVKIGLAQLLKKNARKGLPKKLYSGDRSGKAVLRRVRRWRRRRKS